MRIGQTVVTAFPWHSIALQTLSKAELASMLPGFRFLFAAIVLSMSVLVFGLGAAALLRAAHEEFANLPSRRAPPEPVFARLNDEPMPSLALLRVDLPEADKPQDDVRAAAVPEVAPDIAAPAETAADERPAEPEKVAALSMEERPPAPATEAITETPAARVGTEVPVADVEVVAAIPETSALPAAAAPPRHSRRRMCLRLKATPRRPGSPRSAAPLLSSTKGHRRLRTAAPSGNGHCSVPASGGGSRKRGARGWRARPR